MAALPTQTESPTVKAIYAAYEAKVEPPRRYLGASQIGKPCERALWYEFRWCGREQFSGRLIRLFQRGSLEEHVFADDLKKIGCEVHQVDVETGEQFSVTAVSGHFGGHMDGVCLGIPEAPKTWHLLEFKTHNAKSFAAILADGVREAKPEHWAQMQVYMHLSGMDRAMYMAVNKDTDDLYTERVHYDKSEAEKIIEKAERIVSAKRPPERIGEADTYPCKFCCHNARCHGSVAPEAAVPMMVSCRSCIHATPVIEDGGTGRWRCEKHDKTLTEDEQKAACEDHLLIPELVTFAEQADAGTDPAGDWILYCNADGQTWANSRQPGGYTSAELAMLPASLIGVKGENEVTVDDIKQELNGVVTSVE